MKTINVRLTKRWSTWEPGDVVNLPADRADRIISAGYGRADQSAAAAQAAYVEVRGGPPRKLIVAQTADAPRPAETAVVTPVTEAMAPVTESAPPVTESVATVTESPAATDAEGDGDTDDVAEYDSTGAESDTTEPPATSAPRRRGRPRKAGD